MAHKHEWTWCEEVVTRTNRVVARYVCCRTCSETMNDLEVERRLNATECLPRGVAFETYMQLHGKLLKESGPHLRAYAEALEGDT